MQSEIFFPINFPKDRKMLRNVSTRGAISRGKTEGRVKQGNDENTAESER